MPSRVLVVLDEPGQAEVSDLAHQVVSDQDVGSSQVPVDVVHPLDEGHAVRNLRGKRTAWYQMRSAGVKCKSFCVMSQAQFVLVCRLVC